VEKRALTRLLMSFNARVMAAGIFGSSNALTGRELKWRKKGKDYRRGV
jgi:hypothetical protein